MAAKKKYALKRTLGLFQVTVAGVGIILGAGIYALIGIASRDAGNAVWCNGADAVIGVADTITGSYTPIGRALTNAGSEGYVAVTLF